MKSTQEQIKEIFNTHFAQYSDKFGFIDELGCDKGMCAKFNNNRKFIYQYLPVPVPKSPAEFIFICKEPSTPWAKGTRDAFDKVFSEQYMNFITGDLRNGKLDIMILAFRKVFNNKSILITDMSKCAINTDAADELGLKDNLTHRYICCSPYLQWELTNLSIDNPNIFIVGKNYFFAELFLKKNPEVKVHSEEDIKYFINFLKEVVKVNVAADKVYMIPHYSIRISCPDYLLRMLKINKDEVEREIKTGMCDLFNYYLSNFIFTQKIKEEIKLKLESIEEWCNQKSFSNSSVLLYLLYKNEFEIAKEQWIQKKLEKK